MRVEFPSGTLSGNIVRLINPNDPLDMILGIKFKNYRTEDCLAITTLSFGDLSKNKQKRFFSPVFPFFS